MSKHVLILGGMRHLHRRLWDMQDVRTTILMDIKKVKPVDLERDYRVLALHNDTDELIYMGKALHAIDPFTHIVSFDDRVQEMAVTIAEQLGLDFYPRNVIAGVNDKFYMRNVLREKGVDDNPVANISCEADLFAFAEKHGCPFILKPRAGQGSTGIAKINSGDDILASYKRTLVECAQAEIIAEGFFDGEEFSVEAISENGRHRVIAITKKYKDPITFTEIGHQLPADLPAGTTRAIQEYVCKVLSAIGITDGPTHTEIIVTSQGPRIVETHTRLGGDFIPEMVEDATGVSYIDLSIRRSIGESILEQVDQGLLRYTAPGQKNYAAIWFRADAVQGSLVEIKNVEAVEKTPGVIKVEILKHVGSTIRPTQNSFDRIAAVRTVAASPMEALDRARVLANQIELYVKLQAEETKR